MQGIKLNQISTDVKSNYAYFPIVVDEKQAGYTRNEMCDYLKTKNIYARKYFYPLTNNLECFNNMFDVNKTPVARYISQRVLTLPLFADMTVEEVDRVCEAFYEWKDRANV